MVPYSSTWILHLSFNLVYILTSHRCCTTMMTCWKRKVCQRMKSWMKEWKQPVPSPSQPFGPFSDLALMVEALQNPTAAPKLETRRWHDRALECQDQPLTLLPWSLGKSDTLFSRYLQCCLLNGRSFHKDWRDQSQSEDMLWWSLITLTGQSSHEWLTERAESSEVHLVSCQKSSQNKKDTKKNYEMLPPNKPHYYRSGCWMNWSAMFVKWKLYKVTERNA